MQITYENLAIHRNIYYIFNVNNNRCNLDKIKNKIYFPGH